MSQVKEQLAERLTSVRERTIWLMDQVPEEFLRRRVHSFYSPIGWHFGHVGRTEEYWVCAAVSGQPEDDRLSFLFADLPDNPKDNRVNIPDRQGILEYMARTRRAALDALAQADLDSQNPLVRGGYAWEFAVQHECQHQETIAEMLCLIHQCQGNAIEGDSLASERESQILDIPAGTFLMGSNEWTAYDNEHLAHEVEVQAFGLQQTPVTASQWAVFMEDGGYHRRELWSEDGWAWRCAEDVEKPEYWFRSGSSWACYSALGPRPIHPDEPAASISWYEAEACATYMGMRLPTEAEWEYAARGLADRRYPWGDNDPSESMARHELHELGPAPVGTHPKGASAFGVLDMAGNCWEWTSSTFLPYPGFQPFPYEGYSADHMKGEHFVCRGGSWATAGQILRCSFRNWYVPSYRQGFLGVRLAKDA